MKNLDKKSKEIFLKIYSLLNEVEYTEINNLDGELIPLCVKKMGTVWVNCIKWEKISITQYYVKMGEYYFHPELIILYNKYLKNFICPVYFRYNNEDLEKVDIKFIKYFFRNINKEDIKFIKNWLININNDFKL